MDKKDWFFVSEMTNIIYDTLFKNTQYPQFDTNQVTPLSEFAGDDNYTDVNIPTQYINPYNGIIKFGYNGNEFVVRVRRI